MNRVQELEQALATVPTPATVKQLFSCCPSFEDEQDVAMTLRGLVENGTVRRALGAKGQTGYELVDHPLVNARSPFTHAPATQPASARQAASARLTPDPQAPETPTEKETAMSKTKRTRRLSGWAQEPILDVLRNADEPLSLGAIKTAIDADMADSVLHKTLRHLETTGQITRSGEVFKFRYAIAHGQAKPASKAPAEAAPIIESKAFVDTRAKLLRSRVQVPALKEQGFWLCDLRVSLGNDGQLLVQSRTGGSTATTKAEMAMLLPLMQRINPQAIEQ